MPGLDPDCPVGWQALNIPKCTNNPVTQTRVSENLSAGSESFLGLIWQIHSQCCKQWWVDPASFVGGVGGFMC